MSEWLAARLGVGDHQGRIALIITGAGGERLEMRFAPGEPVSLTDGEGRSASDAIESLSVSEEGLTMSLTPAGVEGLGEDSYRIEITDQQDRAVLSEILARLMRPAATRN